MQNSAAWFVSCCVVLASVRSFAQFSDQTIAAGLLFNHVPGEAHAGQLMEGGGTVGDFNRDGWPDLFVFGGGGVEDGLFINNGDGTFSDQAASWGVQDSHFGVGAAVGDYDRDGWPDIYITSFGVTGNLGPGHHRLYRNVQGTSFVDMAANAGVTTSSPDTHDGYSSAFGDYDLDGDLDLFVTGWFFGSMGNILFQNNGDGTFTDVTDLAGIDRSNTHGFSVHFGDMNDDLFPEILVSADYNSSHYYTNQGDGTFADVTDISGCCVETNGMGGYLGDFNNDYLLDWHITSIFRGNGGLFDGNILMINQGKNQLLVLPESCGMRFGGWAWGTVGLDYDHNGWLDVVSTNGWSTFPSHPTTVFRNNGDLTFSEVSQSLGLIHFDQGRSLVHLDFDRDGDMDVVIFSYGAAMRLFRNDLNSSNKWLQVRAQTSHRNDLAIDGFGTRVTVHAGSLSKSFQINGNANYLGNSEAVAHFGVGDQSDPIHVELHWNDGNSHSYFLPANHRYRILAPDPSLSLPTVVTHWHSTVDDCLQRVPAIHDLVQYVNVGACPPTIDKL